MAFSNAARRAFFAKKAARRAAVNAGLAVDRPANDNMATPAPRRRAMTVALVDACVEAAGFEQHASR